MISVAYGCVRFGKSDRDDRELANYGLRQELVFPDVMTGRPMSRPA